jgi:hypothetical protein
MTNSPNITNIANGHDRVTVQIGMISIAPTRPSEPTTRRPRRGDRDRHTTPEAVQVTNIATGNARVGVRADEIFGDLTITL